MNKEEVIKKVIKLIIDEMEEPEKGQLTSMYAINLLESAIAHIKSTALMYSVHHSL